MSSGDFLLTHSDVPHVTSECQKVVVAAAPGRIPGIDAMRFASILGVIWIHTIAHTPWQIWNGLGRFGAECFTALAAFLIVRSNSGVKSRSFLTFLNGRIKRLLIPFLFWCAIYVGFEPLLGWRGINHLWFLPFIFCCSVLVWPVSLCKSFSREIKTQTILLLLVCGGLTAKFTNVVPQELSDVATSLSMVLLHSWTYIPSVFWGAALALFMSMQSNPNKPPRFLSVLGLIAAVCCIAVLVTTANPMDPVLRNVAGCGFLLVALGLSNNRLVKAVGKLGKSSYGVYLVHPIFMLSFLRVSVNLHCPDTLWLMFARYAFTVLLSIITTNLISRWSRLAWLIPN